MKTKLTRGDEKLIYEMMHHSGIKKKDIPEIARLILGEETALNKSNSTSQNLINDFIKNRKKINKSDSRTFEMLFHTNERECYYIVTDKGNSYVIKSSFIISAQYDLLNKNKKREHNHYCFYVVNQVKKANIMTKYDICSDINWDGKSSFDESIKKVVGIKRITKEEAKPYKEGFNADIIWKGSDRNSTNIIQTYNKIVNVIMHISDSAKKSMKDSGNEKYDRWLKTTNIDELISKSFKKNYD